MLKTKQRHIIAIAMIITAIVICISICSVVIINYINRKQTEKYTYSTELILTDYIYNTTVSLNISNYVDNFNNDTYISDPNILQSAKTQLLEIDSRFNVIIFSDSLLYASIDGECLYYLLRRDMYAVEDVGMRFSTLNMHDLALNDDSLDKFSSILVPYHLFDAFNRPFDSNFPFNYALSFDQPIKISTRISDEENIKAFEEFYNSLGVFTTRIDSNILFITPLNNPFPFSIKFNKGYAAFMV